MKVLTKGTKRARTNDRPPYFIKNFSALTKCSVFNIRASSLKKRLPYFFPIKYPI